MQKCRQAAAPHTLYSNRVFFVVLTFLGVAQFKQSSLKLYRAHLVTGHVPFTQCTVGYKPLS
jgi:hypothetical protein